MVKLKDAHLVIAAGGFQNRPLLASKTEFNWYRRIANLH